MTLNNGDPVLTSSFGMGGYLPFTTRDISKGEWKVVKNAKLPKNPRHGYVIPM